MDRISKLNKIQEDAVDALEANGFIGTVLAATGLGKSWLVQKTIYRAYEKGILKKGDTVWLMAEEVKARKRTFFETEIPGFIEVYGKDITKDFDFQFHSYQSGGKLVEKVKAGKKDLPKLILMDENSSLPF